MAETCTLNNIKFHNPTPISITHDFKLRKSHMKKTLTLIALLSASHFALGQATKPTNAAYEGFSMSLGASYNSTTASSLPSVSAKTTAGVAKINYTFALPFPGKLGLSATFDLTNSKIADQQFLATKLPSEITVDPVFLMVNQSIVYGKVGMYTATYESTLGTRSLTGSAYGLGLKNYFYGNNFVQVEWTRRNTDTNSAGLGGDKFKQNASSISFGYNF